MTGFVRDFRQALRLPLEKWPYLARAVVELAIARTRLHADHSHHLRDAKATRPTPHDALTPAQSDLVDQVAYAIPRIAQRLPWRSDCLIQALAGERWLRRSGVLAQVVIGVNRDGPAPLEAHAWLKAGDRVVTGGGIAAFAPLTE